MLRKQKEMSKDNLWLNPKGQYNGESAAKTLNIVVIARYE